MPLSNDGVVLNGKYRVERLLGKGTFAEVYLLWRSLRMAQPRLSKVKGLSHRLDEHSR